MTDLKQNAPRSLTDGLLFSSSTNNNFLLAVNNSPETRPTHASVIDVRLQQRLGRKSITIVEGLDPALNLLQLMKQIKKKYGVGGSLNQQDKQHPVLLLNGDLRQQVQKWLISDSIATKEQIKMHGS